MQVNLYLDWHLLSKLTQNCCLRQHLFDLAPYREEYKSSLSIASIQWTTKYIIFMLCIVEKWVTLSTVNVLNRCPIHVEKQFLPSNVEQLSVSSNNWDCRVSLLSSNTVSSTWSKPLSLSDRPSSLSNKVSLLLRLRRRLQKKIELPTTISKRNAAPPPVTLVTSNPLSPVLNRKKCFNRSKWRGHFLPLCQLNSLSPIHPVRESAKEVDWTRLLRKCRQFWSFS